MTFPADTPAAPPEPDVSLAEHESSFPAAGKIPSPSLLAQEPDDDEPVPEPDEPAPPREEPPAPTPPAPQETRTRTPRHRARSQQATPADAPRIQELTAKLRETEKQVTALQQRLSTPPPLPKEPAAFTDPEPDPNQFDDALALARAQSAWDRRKAESDAQQSSYTTARETADRDRITRNDAFFKTKHDAHMSRMDAYYQQTPTAQADFERAKDQDITAVMAAAVSLLDDQSPRALHTLVKDHDLRDELVLQTLGKPLTPQLVALVQRRILSRMPAVLTGSVAAARSPVLVPRPPNPVRTTPQVPADQPPDDRAPLSAHERAFPLRRRH